MSWPVQNKQIVPRRFGKGALHTAEFLHGQVWLYAVAVAPHLPNGRRALRRVQIGNHDIPPGARHFDPDEAGKGGFTHPAFLTDKR